MTTTDPKLIERMARAMCREEVHYGDPERVIQSRVDYDWKEYVAKATAILPIVAAAINEAAQKERAGILRWIARNGDRVASVSTARMEGDNLAVTLCSHFDNPDQETDDDTGWTEDAVDGCNEVITAIVKFFADAIEAKESQP